MNKISYKPLFGKNEFSVVPRIFGCICFVRYHILFVGKLVLRVIKRIFLALKDLVDALQASLYKSRNALSPNGSS